MCLIPIIFEDLFKVNKIPRYNKILKQVTGNNMHISNFMHTKNIINNNNINKRK